MGEVHCLGPLFIWTEMAASSRIQSLTRKMSGIAVQITYSPGEGTINEEGSQGRTLFTLSWELTPGHLLETESNHFIISYLFQLPVFLN